MVKKTDKEMVEINSRDEIPEFQNEDEEHEFWSTHSFGEKLLDEFEPRSERDGLPPPRPETKARTNQLTLDVDKNLAKRLKALADTKGVEYQTLLHQFIAERVYEEEKREGILK